jgi:hypothetical protein
MAFQAFGDISMPGMMTRRAIEFRMLRNIRFHLLIQLRVAYVTTLLQGTLGRDVHRCVNFRVTSGTLCQILSVHLVVTGIALGQDLFILHLAGAIDVEFHMALSTAYPVLTTIVSYKVIKVRMAPPTVF